MKKEKPKPGPDRRLHLDAASGRKVTSGRHKIGRSLGFTPFYNYPSSQVYSGVSCSQRLHRRGALRYGHGCAQGPDVVERSAAGLPVRWGKLFFVAERVAATSKISLSFCASRRRVHDKMYEKPSWELRKARTLSQMLRLTFCRAVRSASEHRSAHTLNGRKARHLGASWWRAGAQVFADV